MAKIGVCIEPFFTDCSYEERIKKISDIGFSNYEFWFHNKRFDGTNLIDEMKDFDRIAELNEKYNLTTTDFVFNHPDGGIVGALINSNEKNYILDNLEEMIQYAKKIKCKAFISGSGNRIAGQPEEEAIENMTTALKAIGEICRREDITIFLEPFNTRVDHPDYFLNSPQMCIDILKAVDNSHVKMLYDIYHMQIMDGNICDFIRENIQHIGHFHIAGVPGRHEPMDNELNYPFIINEIDKLGYTGGFGLEYWATTDDEKSLRDTLEFLNTK